MICALHKAGGGALSFFDDDDDDDSSRSNTTCTLENAQASSSDVASTIITGIFLCFSNETVTIIGTFSTPGIHSAALISESTCTVGLFPPPPSFAGTTVILGNNVFCKAVCIP